MTQAAHIILFVLIYANDFFDIIIMMIIVVFRMYVRPKWPYYFSGGPEILEKRNYQTELYVS